MYNCRNLIHGNNFQVPKYESWNIFDGAEKLIDFLDALIVAMIVYAWIVKTRDDELKWCFSKILLQINFSFFIFTENND